MSDKLNVVVYELPKPYGLDEITATAFTFDFLKQAFWFYRNRLMNLSDLQRFEAPSWLLGATGDAEHYWAQMNNVCKRYNLSPEVGKRLITFLDYVHDMEGKDFFEIALYTQVLAFDLIEWEIEFHYGDFVSPSFKTISKF